MSKNNKITISFDMDGVLADVWKYLKTHNIVDGPLDKRADANVRDAVKKVERFYYQLEPIPGGLELFEDAVEITVTNNCVRYVPRKQNIAGG